MLILDQANDSADTGGQFICDDESFAGCAYVTGDQDGRIINGVTHSQQQVVRVTGVSGSGTGPYSVTLSRPVYFNNVRAGQSPGAYRSEERRVGKECRSRWSPYH